MAPLGGACGDFDLFPNLGERTAWPTVRPAVRLSLWPFSLSDRPGKKKKKRSQGASFYWRRESEGNSEAAIASPFFNQCLIIRRRLRPLSDCAKT